MSTLARRLTMGTADGRPRRRRPTSPPEVAEIRRILGPASEDRPEDVDLDALRDAATRLGARSGRMLYADAIVYTAANKYLLDRTGSAPGPIAGVLR